MSYGDYVEQLTYQLFLKMSDERIKAPYNKPSKKKGLLGLIFNKSHNKFQYPAKLRRLLVDLIGKENWSIMSADVKNDAYEGLLEKNAQETKSEAGQYFTLKTNPLKCKDLDDFVKCYNPQAARTASQPGRRICRQSYLRKTTSLQVDGDPTTMTKSSTVIRQVLISSGSRMHPWKIRKTCRSQVLLPQKLLKTSKPHWNSSEKSPRT